ncbi:MAG TPA: hypothetical protein VFQ78_12190 [Candidatus Udaeobacter sp.]|nr:hypothetical protein [Candidatus Udaeobacter sp.]
MKRFTIAVLIAVSLAVLTVTSLGQAKKPNILVIFGDDIGQTNVNAYSLGMMGYKTWKRWLLNDSRTGWALALSGVGFSRSTTTKAHPTAFSGAHLALARSLLTPPSWIRAISILVRAGSTTSMSAIASRVTPLTSAQA